MYMVVYLFMRADRQTTAVHIRFKTMLSGSNKNMPRKERQPNE